MIGYRLDSSGRSQTRHVVQTRQEEVADDRRLYCCAVCQQAITSESAAVAIDSEHSHLKINPDGRKFFIQCFSSAAGCRKVGELTGYFSWFAGYSWQFAHCGQCGAQLGWFFSGSDPFFGLIKEQLVSCHNA